MSIGVAATKLSPISADTVREESFRFRPCTGKRNPADSGMETLTVMAAAALPITENNMELEEGTQVAERPEALGPTRLITSTDELSKFGRQRVNVFPTPSGLVNAKVMFRPVGLP